MGLFTAGVAAGLVVFLGAAPPMAVASPARPRGPGVADLSVRLTAAPQVAQPGHWLSYRVRVRNAGPGDAVLPVLTLRVPEQVDIVHVDVAACHPGASRNEVVCPSPSDIPSGGSGAVTVFGKVRAGARGPLRADARLTSEVLDDNQADNRAGLVTKVGPARPAHRQGPESRRSGGGVVRHGAVLAGVDVGRSGRGEDRARRREHRGEQNQPGACEFHQEGGDRSGFEHVGDHTTDDAERYRFRRT
jgi:hypothetical protein